MRKSATPNDATEQKHPAPEIVVHVLREQPAEQEQLIFLLVADVMERTKYSQSGIYALMSRKDDPFPSPYRLSPNRVAWLQSEVDAWLRARIAKGPALPQGNLTMLTEDEIQARTKKALEAKARKRKERAA